MATVYLAQGNSRPAGADEAVPWLARTVLDRPACLFCIVTWPEFDALRADPASAG
jgi:hypothetical protein